jgi:hypothetical protein
MCVTDGISERHAFNFLSCGYYFAINNQASSRIVIESGNAKYADHLI